MTCAGCTANVTHALQAIPGVINVQVSLATGDAAVRFDERQAAPEQLMSAVRRAGYGVESGNGAPAANVGVDADIKAVKLR